MKNLFINVKMFSSLTRRQGGAVLITMLVFIAIGAIILTPVLHYIGSGLLSGQVFQDKADQYYAADAGIEDGIWRLRNDRLEEVLDPGPSYDPYDFSQTWSYTLPELVNGLPVTVDISNEWMVMGFSAPTTGQATSTIANGKFIVVGKVTGGLGTDTLTYEITLTQYKILGQDLRVKQIGIWLPAGFTYAGTSNLEANLAADYYPDSVNTPTHRSGTAVIWNYDAPGLLFSDLPGVIDDDPLISKITFSVHTDRIGVTPDAVSWIDTNTNLGGGINQSWDADIKVLQLVSTAQSARGSTTVEARMVKNESREFVSTIAGDYRAVGNSLMLDEDHDWGGPVRDELLDESDAEINDIPADARVDRAYLYWSAWYQFSHATIVWGPDNASNFSNPPIAWSRGNDPAWEISSNRFRGTGYNNTGRYLTMSSSINLAPQSGKNIAVSWIQDDGGTLESADRLQFQFSNNNGATWGSLYTAFSDNLPDVTGGDQRFTFKIPSEYLSNQFKMRFFLDGFNSNGEYAYVDDIVIVELVADTSVSFKINGQQVYFNSSGKPLQGSHPLTPSASLRGDKTQALVNETTYFPGSYFYSVRVEVTDLINEFGTLAPSPATNRPGNDSYTVGDVSGDLNTQISNAGWSLVIVYSSAETKGNQLYLYDNFITSGDNTQSVDFDGDGEPGGTIGGFLVPEKEPEETLAARLTAFVIEGDDYYDGDYIALNGTKLWDNTTTGGNTSQDPDDVWNGVSLGMSADGVDVDTFEVPWGNPVSSGLLVPGVSSAQIDMHTGTDIWQMVYIIISFRSESTTGGAISYLIQ